MQMTHREAVALSVILQEFGAPSVWQAVCGGGHEGIILGAKRRLEDCLSAHWQENGCSFDAGRDGMQFPDACEAARPGPGVP
jgi:hypothetical protein